MFYFAQPVVGVDSETFEPFDAEFWTSDNPSPEAVRCRSDMWARDRNHVYFQHLAMEGLDPTTSQIVGRMLKDATQVYAGYNRLVLGADAPSFEPVPGSLSYYRDRWRVYSGEKLIEGADPRTFEVLPQKHSSKGDAWDVNWIYQHENRWKPRSDFPG